MKTKGFTLIEVSIVLIIIGLMLGGILKVQELTYNLKLTNTERMLEDIYTAHLLYKDRYTKPAGSMNSYYATNTEKFFSDLKDSGLLSFESYNFDIPKEYQGLVAKKQQSSPSHGFNQGFFITEITDTNLTQYLCALLENREADLIFQRQNVKNVNNFNNLPCIKLYTD